jgi:hypothetical protein
MYPFRGDGQRRIELRATAYRDAPLFRLQAQRLGLDAGLVCHVGEGPPIDNVFLVDPLRRDCVGPSKGGRGETLSKVLLRQLALVQNERKEIVTESEDATDDQELGLVFN